MKRCIICGNVGEDDSKVCAVCGNPYIDQDDNDHGEAVRDPEIVVESDENPETADTESAGKPETHEDAEAAEEAEPVVKPEAPSRRMKSGPQIYGQENGEMTASGEASGAFRREINGRDRNVRGQRPSQSPAMDVRGGGARPAGYPERAANGTRRTGAPQRPVNGQGRPNGPQRPANGQNRPNGPQRPANGQGRPNGPQRPANGQGRPNGSQRPVSMQSGRIRSMARGMMRSPLLLLAALLQTAAFGGSIAAIFMDQLNFRQVMRLLTSLPLPQQLIGYTVQLLKLAEKLDTGAVAVNLALHIPDLLMCLGLWAIVLAALTKKARMSGAGFTFIKIVVLIGLIKNGLIMIAGLVISVTLLVSAGVSGVKSMMIAGVITLVIMIVATMFVVMYYFSYLATLKTFRMNAVEGESYGEASGYVAFVYVLMGLFSIIGLLSGIVNSEISGIVGSAGKIGWMLLFAVWILRYRSKLGAIED